MPELDAQQKKQKLCRIWTRRRQEKVPVWVYYGVVEERGCRIYSLDRMEELE